MEYRKREEMQSSGLECKMNDEDGSEHDRHDFDRQRVGVDASVEEDSELDATTVADGEAHEQANDEQGRELLS